MPLRPHFRDARGRSHPLTPPVSLWRPNRGGLPLGRRWRIEVTTDVPPDVKRRITVACVAAAAPLVVVLGPAIPLLQAVIPVTGYRSFLVLLPAAVMLGMSLPLVLARIARGSASQHIAAAYAKAGYCGSCCYPLEGTTPQPDSCTVCPECGSAFVLPAARPSA